MKILFVTWDGPQLNYLESLFLPIFLKLRSFGYTFHNMQFTWEVKGEAQKPRFSFNVENGITYQRETVCRYPVALGSFITAIYGGHLIKKAIRVHKIDAVMPRSTLPALATLFALKGTLFPMIFDADGLPIDERIEYSGHSPVSFTQRLMRDIEAQAVYRADVVLTRTERANDILFARGGAGSYREKFEVVINGRDENLFRSVNSNERKLIKDELKLNHESPLIIYVGSIGGKYRLNEMIKLYGYIKNMIESATFIVLTPSTDVALEMFQTYPKLLESTKILNVSVAEVARYLSCADLGLALITPGFSMKAASALKIGEYLLSGLPVITMTGIGNSGTVCGDAGYILPSMEDSDLRSAADWFVKKVLPDQEKFRKAALHAGRSSYSITAAVNSYHNALSKYLA